MILYLARHGEAKSPSPDQPSLLTHKGQKDVTKMAQDLKKEGICPVLIWHSPKERAVQTAEIYMQILGIPLTAREEKKKLKPDDNPEEILEEILGEKGESLMIVGHLPFLDKLAFILLKEPSQNSIPSFPTSSVACLKRGPGDAWEIIWMKNP